MDEATFALIIVTPQATQRLTVTQVHLATPSGSLVVCKGHAPTLTALSEESTLCYTDADKTDHTRAISSGLAHIDRESITVVTHH